MVILSKDFGSSGRRPPADFQSVGCPRVAKVRNTVVFFSFVLLLYLQQCAFKILCCPWYGFYRLNRFYFHIYGRTGRLLFHLSMLASRFLGSPCVKKMLKASDMLITMAIQAHFSNFALPGEFGFCGSNCFESFLRHCSSCVKQNVHGRYMCRCTAYLLDQLDSVFLEVLSA